MYLESIELLTPPLNELFTFDVELAIDDPAVIPELTRDFNWGLRPFTKVVLGMRDREGEAVRDQLSGCMGLAKVSAWADVA